jgi:hypothetical protein
MTWLLHCWRRYGRLLSRITATDELDPVTASASEAVSDDADPVTASASEAVSDDTDPVTASASEAVSDDSSGEYCTP